MWNSARFLHATHLTTLLTTMQRLNQFLLFSMLCCIFFWQPNARAGNIDVTVAHIETSDEGYRLVASFSFDLSHELENMITRGIPLYFVTEVAISRPRWYWLDEKAVNISQSVRISYNVLTRQYRASINGSFAQNFQDLDEALSLIRRPSRWVVAEKSALTAGATYNVAIQTRLDTSQLPKPFQFNALNNSEWRLSSDWKRFTFKADEK